MDLTLRYSELAATLAKQSVDQRIVAQVGGQRFLAHESALL